MISNTEIQTLLNNHGYSLKVDGIIGPVTIHAIRDLQTKHGLASDGIVGPATLAVLRRPIKEYLKDIPSQGISLVLSTPIKGSVSVVRTANQYGNYVKFLADRIDIDPALAIAFLHVESGGSAIVNNRMVIRFENHQFKKYLNNDTLYNQHFVHASNKVWTGHKFKLNGAWLESHIWPANGITGNQEREWSAFGVAQQLSDYAAKMSISMGLPQIMGFNHNLIGYKNVNEMFNSFASVHLQIAGFFDFGLNSNPKMITYLKQKNFFELAKAYNGSGQATEYARRIKTEYEALQPLLKD